MYIQFNGNIKVPDEEAFMFACGMLEDGALLEKQTFMDIMKDADTFEEAKKNLIDYAYSGNWVHREE